MQIPPSAQDLALFAILRDRPSRVLMADVAHLWSATGLRREDLTQTLWRMRDRRLLEFSEGEEVEWIAVTPTGRRSMMRRPTSPRAWWQFWRDTWLLWQLRNRPWVPSRPPGVTETDARRETAPLRTGESRLRH